MHYAINLAPFDHFADPHRTAELAQRAEAAGWDGFYIWDHIQYREPVDEVADPWITMAAIAQATTRIRIGPMVTPLARRRPQLVAKQTTTLDHLSGGRLTLGVGLGLDRSGRELSAFGEELDARTRAAMLDESLDLITDLWSGEPVDHRGTRYLAEDVQFLPRPIQQPRIPVWCAARYPNAAPRRRAARWDGMYIIDIDHPDQLAETGAAVAAQRPSGDLAGFELATGGDLHTSPSGYAEAGASWWIINADSWTVTPDQVEAVVDAGPAALD